MRVLLLFLFCSVLNTSFGQRTIRIEKIADQFYAKVFIADTVKMFSDGWIAVYDTSKNLLIKTTAVDLNIHKHLHKFADIWYYDDQDLVIYDDLTFDGVKDFALFNGQRGAYGAPTFDIFIGRDSIFPVTDSNLSQKKIQKLTDKKLKSGIPDTTWFVYSPEFTHVMEEDGSIFEMDEINKTITLINRLQLNVYSYLLSTYGIRDNIPYLIKREEQRVGMPKGMFQ